MLINEITQLSNQNNQTSVKKPRMRKNVININYKHSCIQRLMEKVCIIQNQPRRLRMTFNRKWPQFVS